jgi:hypothetical protein
VDLSGKRRTLSTGWSDIRGLAWSPDGEEIWFTATRAGVELNLWGVSLDGHERQVYRAPGNLQIQDSRSDGHILLTVGRTSPTLKGLAAGETEERDLSWLDWGYPGDISLDGKTLLFSEQGDGGRPLSTTRDMAGSAPVLLNRIAFSLTRWQMALVLNLPNRRSGSPPHRCRRSPTTASRSDTQFHWAAFSDGKRCDHRQRSRQGRVRVGMSGRRSSRDHA